MIGIVVGVSLLVTKNNKDDDYQDDFNDDHILTDNQISIINSFPEDLTEFHSGSSSDEFNLLDIMVRVDNNFLQGLYYD
jgi:hypothetical protein